jgi:tetratricopeptide (TPR) repeat protein
MMRKSIQIFWSAFLLLFVGLQLAFSREYSVYPTEQEYATLPPYCKEKIEKKNPTENKMWSDRFGANTWLHMHHYCQGLNDINRYYLESDRALRNDLLSSAVGQFDYVIGHVPTDSVLLADAYQNRGHVQLMLRNAVDGVTDLQKALELNPRISQAYLLLADQFESWKKRDKALQIVSDGLRYIPASKVLQQRYRELGGKQPYPEPYEKPAEQNIASETKVGTETAAADKATPNSSTPNAANPAENNPSIGMPGNPYCRFCPDVDERRPGSPQTPH